MPKARLVLDRAQPAAEALARGQTIAAAVTAERPVAIYGAPLELAAVALGAYQYAGHALRPDAFGAMAMPVLRRRSGGAAVWAGEGVLYFALGLHDASALMACPPGKLLNRNVRGLLAGARSLGVPAHYFGRDFVSFATDPGAYIAWDQDAEGRVLLEAFVALDAPFVLPPAFGGYPTPHEPALRGKVPTTLRKAGSTHDAEHVLNALADGYGRGFALEFEREAPNAAELATVASIRAQLAVDVHDALALHWAQPVEEAIGFISAGARLDPNSAIAALTLGGDFFQHRACPEHLRSLLVGHTADADAIGAALDQVYAARPGLLEGIRSLNSMRSALLAALELAGS